MDEQVAVEAQPEIHINSQPEPEYVLGPHGELRRSLPKRAPKAKNRVAAGIKEKNGKLRKHHYKK